MTIFIKTFNDTKIKFQWCHCWKVITIFIKSEVMQLTKVFFFFCLFLMTMQEYFPSVHFSEKFVQYCDLSLAHHAFNQISLLRSLGVVVE